MHQRMTIEWSYTRFYNSCKVTFQILGKAWKMLENIRLGIRKFILNINIVQLYSIKKENNKIKK